MGQYDILVRHVAHRQAHAMAQGLLPEAQVQTARWIDTQLTVLRERRADKALAVEAGDRRGLLEIEFAVDPGRAVLYRMFQYTSLLIIAQHAASSGATASPTDSHRILEPHASSEPDPDIEEDAPAEPVDAVLVILRGRRRPWPTTGRYRTSPPGAPFSGQHFRIEAVYQRTVDELWSRPGSFWLVFTCLAVDANVEKMRAVIDEIRRREPCEDDRQELYLALLTLAELDPWGYHLQEEIEAMLQQHVIDELMKKTWVRELVAMNREDALEEGLEKGLEKGLTEGREAGRKAVIEEMLRHQLVRQLQRELTPEEQALLSTRAGGLGAAQVADLLAPSGAGSLVDWLFGPDARPGTGDAGSSAAAT